MFLCEEHYDGPAWWKDLLLRSYGPCEVCGVVTATYDVPPQLAQPKDKA